VLLWLQGCLDYGLGDPDRTAVAPLPVTERFVQSGYARVDVLLVVDGTGSMAEEQAGFAGAAQRFLDRLEALGVDYQVGVTTMDPADGGALQGRPWIITPAAEDPAAALADALRVGTDSTGPSAGLDVAALALEDAGGTNLGFLRSDAALHLVFVSDADDESAEVLGADPVAALEARLAARAELTGREVVASAVVGDAPDGCTGPGGTALPGLRYLDLAARTGGASLSICVSDFSPVVEAMGGVAVEWPVRFELQAEPVAGSVWVEVDGARADGWSLETDPPAVVFDLAPSGGAEILVHYTLEGA